MYISVSLLYLNKWLIFLPRNYKCLRPNWYSVMPELSKWNIWAITFGDGDDLMSVRLKTVRLTLISDEDPMWHTHTWVGVDADQCLCLSPSFALSLSSLMHRTRTADSQDIAKRPFVCTPLLVQEYSDFQRAQTSPVQVSWGQITS